MSTNKKDNNIITMDPVIYNDIIKGLMQHRTAVETTLNAVAQDLMTRGRVHDNSVTDDTEMILNYKCITSPGGDVHKYEEMVKGLHAQNNDHHIDYFPDGLYDMNLIQLMEYIADQMARLDAATDTTGWTSAEYVNHFDCSDITNPLKYIIKETVDYILNLVPKREQWTNAMKEELDKDAKKKEPTVRPI